METLDFFPFDVKRREICFGQLLIDPDWPFSRMTNFEKLQKKFPRFPPWGRNFKKILPRGDSLEISEIFSKFVIQLNDEHESIKNCPMGLNKHISRRFIK